MKMKKTNKVRNWLMAASGAAAITLGAFGSSAMAVNTLQSQEVKVGSVTTSSSNDIDGRNKQLCEKKLKANPFCTNLLYWVKLLDEFKILVEIIALMPIVVGVCSYWGNERWKRRQYVDEKIKAFENQPETINVRKMLSSELQCIELFPFLDKHNERYVVVEDKLWAQALLDSKYNKILRKEHDYIDALRKEHNSIDTTKDDNFFHQEPVMKAVIRDNFNRFLNDLQQFEKMIKSHVAKESSLRNYLDAWIERIDQADNESRVKCRVLHQEYSPKEVLFEYLGLTKSDPKKDPSVVQTDVRALIQRYRQLKSGNLIEVKSENEIWIEVRDSFNLDFLSYLRQSIFLNSSSQSRALQRHDTLH